jgi:ubiquinone/menaquinone biosynthesis C-methylase UbiE/uncharacterized protein YbaR (Trm112 family)
METNNSEIVCCPKCKHDLFFKMDGKAVKHLSGTWKCRHCGKEYPDKEGFIQFVWDKDVFRSTRREEIIRALYARLYTPLTNLMFIPCGGVAKARHEVLENLEMKPGSLVLETGIGTGDNIPYLNGMMDGCPYYGLDNQAIMLRNCTRNSHKWEQTVHLYRANAEELPFKDNSFDVVFHLGAINLFKDKKSAIDEMIRVAKPGTKIVIADESEKASKLFSIFVGRHDPVIPPVGLIPLEMKEISLKSIWNHYGYLITFRKPG